MSKVPFENTKWNKVMNFGEPTPNHLLAVNLFMVGGGIMSPGKIDLRYQLEVWLCTMVTLFGPNYQTIRQKNNVLYCQIFWAPKFTAANQ